MAFTQADLDSIDQALLHLALGKRVTSVTISGDTTTFDSGASVEQLQQIRATVAASISTTYSPRTNAKNGGRP